MADCRYFFCVVFNRVSVWFFKRPTLLVRYWHFYSDNLEMSRILIFDKLFAKYEMIGLFAFKALLGKRQC